MLAGNVFSIGISWFICMGQALVAPDDYDWQSLKEIALLDDDQSGLDAEDLSEEKLVPALDWIKRVGWSTTFVLIVLWPALSTPAGVDRAGQRTMRTKVVLQPTRLIQSSAGTSFSSLRSSASRPLWSSSSSAISLSDCQS